MTTAVIFGASGQDGHYLARLLREEGVRVVMVARTPGGDIVPGDVSDRSFVRGLLGESRPDYVFHLAAKSSVRHEFVGENFEAIVRGALNVLESVLELKMDCRVFLAGSALQFRNLGKPIRTADERVSEDGYSMCRNMALESARYYRERGLKVFYGFLFHHDSPFRAPGHLVGEVLDFVSKYPAGGETLSLADPGFVKEWNHAVDIARAIWLLVQQDDVSECVIGSGVGASIEEFVLECFEQAGVPRNCLDPEGTKPEGRVIVSDPVELFDLGWRPTIDMKGLVKDLFSSRV